jgi:hypothetical protein
MSANEPIPETDVIDRAVAWLGERLPEQWEVERGADVVEPDGVPRREPVLHIRSPNRTIGTVAVEARSSLEPREAASLLGGLAQTLRSLAGSVPVLVIAPWLSARTRELLTVQGVNYIDLTGNALVSLSSPGLFISSQGADRNPQPQARRQALLRGPRAARLIRLLVDVRPPYGVTELALAAGLTPGYVSRLLDALDREALVERSRRGVVESVDFAGLLRRWSETYDVLRANGAFTFLAPNGAGDALERLAAASIDGRWLITGSFAAVRLAPVAAPASLVLYCEQPATLARELGLVPADEGANVVLLAPFDMVVWKRSSEDAGLRYAAVSQVTVDCLTGTGRMPAEGEALLEWMRANEPAWRYESLDRLPRREE